MRLAYFDCFSGLSGDMALAALIHAGADFDSIAEVLHSFPSEDFSLQGEEVEVRGLSALRVHIESGPQGVIRTYANIRALLEEVELPGEVRRTAHRIYNRLANAAAKVHGKDPELVTFVEFGELDCLVEFVGCALALHQLGVDRVFASPIPTGMGMARTEHGIMPIPS
ncbi:MAG TPA: nickel insertion protein, partial [Actinomycetota bacterium]